MDDPYNPSGMDEFIPYRVNVLYRLLTRRGTRMLAGRHGLSLAEWWTLTQLANNRANTVSQLAENTYMDKAQTSRAVDSLIRKGFATRRPDPADRRSTLYEVTDAGRARFDDVFPERLLLHRAMVDTMGSDETRQFMRSINQLIELLEAHDS